jgi:hypothetical protein
MLFRLADGTTFEVTPCQSELWQREFAAINVRHRLLLSQAGMEDSPRYTRAGIAQALISWLIRGEEWEANRGK